MMCLIIIPLLLPLLSGLIDAVTVRRGYILAAGTLITAILLTLSLFNIVHLVPYTFSIVHGIVMQICASRFWLTIAVVTLWIAFLIVLYSIGYMWLDYRRGWFWFFVGLMLTCTLLLLFAEDLLSLIIAWDGMELCSYALIGHWYRDEPERHVGEGFSIGKFVHLWSPSSAAYRAVVITSVGTSCLLAATGLLFAKYRTLSISALAHADPVTVILILVAAFATSAQLPFTEWLFTAMAGPTPVSALIHSITLVNAGAYLVLKLAHLLHGSPVLTYALFLVLISIVMMGLCGLASREVKVILAASTCIYVGLLLFDALLYANTLDELCLTCAILILIGHGFSKAALFSSCGYLMHMAGTRFVDDVKIMLRFRQSYIALLLASLNLFGIVIPSAGFMFKELLLEMSSTVQSVLILISAAISIGLLLKILLYFNDLRKNATVVEHVEPHEMTMEIASIGLAIAPFVLFLPFWSLEGRILEPLRLAITYALFIVVLFLSIELYRRRNEISRSLLTLLKVRFGLALLLDYVIGRGFITFSKSVYSMFKVLDNAIHAGYAYLKAMYKAYNFDKLLDKILHVALPRAFSCFSRNIVERHVSKLVNYMIVIATLLTIAILYILLAV